MRGGPTAGGTGPWVGVPRRSDAGGRTGACWVRGTASGHGGGGEGRAVVSCSVCVARYFVFSKENRKKDGMFEPCSNHLSLRWAPEMILYHGTEYIFTSVLIAMSMRCDTLCDGP